MTYRTDEDGSPESSFNPAAMRLHLAELCEAVAVTEDEVAHTLGEMATTRPRDAARLRARATMARQYAALERNRATRYRRTPARRVESAHDQSSPYRRS